MYNHQFIVLSILIIRVQVELFKESHHTRTVIQKTFCLLLNLCVNVKFGHEKEWRSQSPTLPSMSPSVPSVRRSIWEYNWIQKRSLLESIYFQFAVENKLRNQSLFLNWRTNLLRKVLVRKALNLLHTYLCVKIGLEMSYLYNIS
jgi:hypothetical protein